MCKFPDYAVKYLSVRFCIAKLFIWVPPLAQKLGKSLSVSCLFMGNILNRWIATQLMKMTVKSPIFSYFVASWKFHLHCLFSFRDVDPYPYWNKALGPSLWDCNISENTLVGFQYFLQISIAVCCSYFMNLICNHFLQAGNEKHRKQSPVYKCMYFMLTICSYYLSVPPTFIIFAEDFILFYCLWGFTCLKWCYSM